MSLVVAEQVTKSYQTGEVEVQALRGIEFHHRGGIARLVRWALGERKDHPPQPDRMSGQTLRRKPSCR